ncbi:arabinofuranosyltransferase [Lentzea sp. NPDC051838]|uniref:arabinofuranosyltransferase n=1 Tax=Lentzea sp. NPDC051838 TaxID=3154849 RepID=UPI0034226B44
MEAPSRGSRFRRVLLSPVTVALATWVLALPVAVVLPRIADVSPFSENGIFLPLGVGLLALAAVTALAWRPRAGELVSAAGAGLLAAWVVLVFRTGLYGSPWGTTGLMNGGDRTRTAAAAMRDTVSLLPTDQFVAEAPAEYPPLFPWLVAKSSLLVGVPVWRLLVVFEVGLLSLAVLATFLMWRRIVPAPAALVISGVSLFVNGDPRKAFAVITLFVTVPWLISTLGEPKRGRLHWLPAGIIAGVMMMLYNGWYAFGVIGFAAIAISTWRRVGDKGAYVRHVLLAAGVALLVASPYLAPYAFGVLTEKGQAVSDEFVFNGQTLNAFPFLKPSLLGVLELVGLAGLVWYRGRTDWARPLLYLLVGAYLFWLLAGLRFVFSTHTTLYFYVPVLIGAILVPAGVLTLATAGPAFAKRFSFPTPYRAGAAVVAVSLVWVVYAYWQDWRPSTETATTVTYNTAGTFNTYTGWAHLSPLPDCTYPRFAPKEGRFDCLAANRIIAEVEQVRGKGAMPRTVASDERLFAYVPWPGYMGVDRTAASTLTRWDDRQAEVHRISEITDPAEFARASANTEFGSIDVFLMTKSADQKWWDAVLASFRPESFDSSKWLIVQDLPGGQVLAVRKP